MSHIFISHVEEDAEIAKQIAKGLEAAGYTTWYYERDTLPGMSYLIQITQAIERCQAIVLVISGNSVDSGQVAREVVSSFESSKHCIPVLLGMTHAQFQQHQPEWRHALAGTATVSTSAQDLSVSIARIIGGLQALSIQPEARQEPTSAVEPVTQPSVEDEELAEKVNLLARVCLFDSVKSANVVDLACKLTSQTYRRGETMFHQGDRGSTLYIIKSGQVKITTTSTKGNEVILAILVDNDFFGELSLLDERPRSASATAMASTQVLTMERQDYLDTIRKDPQLAGRILSCISDRLRSTDALVEDAVSLDLPGRLAKLLLELGQKHGLKMNEGLEIDLGLTQQDLANAVGATRVAVNKLLGQFQDKGLLRVDKQRITILLPDELKKEIC